MLIQDEAADLIGFVGDERFGEEVGEGDIRENHLGGDAFLGGGGGDTGQFIAGAARRGFGHEFAEGSELIGAGADLGTPAVHAMRQKKVFTCLPSGWCCRRGGGAAPVTSCVRRLFAGPER